MYIRQLFNSDWGFGGSIEGLFDGISFELGDIHLMLMAVVLFVWLLDKKERKVSILGFLFAGLTMSIFLTNIRSSFLWKNIPLMDFVQFPWRFLFFAGMFISLIIGYLGKRLKNAKQNEAVAVILIVLLMIVNNKVLFTEERSLVSGDELLAESTELIQTGISRTLPEYINPFYKDIVLKNTNVVIEPPISRYDYLGVQKKEMVILEDKVQEFVIRVYPEGPGQLIINIFSFPGWTFYVDGDKTETLVGKNKPVYVLQLSDSLGEEVVVRGVLENTMIRKVGNVLSLIGIGIVIYLGFDLVGSKKSEHYI